MYDVLKVDYAKPNGITENRLKKPIMQNHRSEIPNDGFVYPAILDVELNPWFCRGKKIMSKKAPTTASIGSLIRNKHFRLAVFCKDYRRRQQIL